MAAARTQKEIRQKAPIWLLMLLVVNIGLMSLDARDDSSKQRLIRVWTQALAAPFQRATSSFGGASVGLIRKIINFRSTAAENEQLKEQVNNLQLELRKAHEATNENERLRELLNLKEKTGYDFVAASVIARDPSAWFNTITINQGSS